MIYRIFPTKDTFITNFRRRNIAMTSSNVGRSEDLQIFKIASTTYQPVSLARTLMHFDFSYIPSGSSQKFNLVLKDMQHNYTLPSSFDAEVQALTQDWDEGRGHDVDFFTDKGFCNWDKSKSNVFWSVTGSLATGSIANFHFDNGDEDLNVDVTDIVENWISDPTSNYGFQIRLSSSMENDSSDYFVKMFHSRHTFFNDYRPYIEVAWDDSILTGSTTAISDDGPFVFNIVNLKDEYELEENPQLRLYIRKRDYNPSVVLTASSDAIGL